jgi:hypothetical protein
MRLLCTTGAFGFRLRRTHGLCINSLVSVPSRPVTIFPDFLLLLYSVRRRCYENKVKMRTNGRLRMYGCIIKELGGVGGLVDERYEW